MAEDRYPKKYTVAVRIILVFCGGLYIFLIILAEYLRQAGAKRVPAVGSKQENNEG